MVVDASVLVAATADAGPQGVWAEAIVGQGALVAPELALVESTNILRRLELAGKLSALESTSAQRQIVELSITLVPFEPVSERVWELRTNVTSYDAWYIAIAEVLDIPLATLDEKLSRASGPRCRFVLPE